MTEAELQSILKFVTDAAGAHWVPARVVPETIGTALITAATVTTALGFLGKWWFEQFGHKLAAKRTFSQETAKKVVELGDQYYWPIANAAGTLAGELRQYLRSYELHLYLDWEDVDHLRLRHKQIAKDAAKRSVESLEKLLGKFHDFHIKKGQTYLLPHHGSGRQLRRLYNRFTGKLPDEFLEFGSTTTSESQSKRLKAYQSWLHYNLADVVVATETLEAFARLFQHELAILYQDWFHDRRPDDDIVLPAIDVMRLRWPGLLAESDISTLASARGESDFLGNLRIAAKSEQTAERQQVKEEPPPPPPTDAPNSAAAAGLAAATNKPSFVQPGANS